MVEDDDDGTTASSALLPGPELNPGDVLVSFLQETGNSHFERLERSKTALRRQLDTAKIRASRFVAAAIHAENAVVSNTHLYGYVTTTIALTKEGMLLARWITGPLCVCHYSEYTPLTRCCAVCMRCSLSYAAREMEHRNEDTLHRRLWALVRHDVLGIRA